jgi:hypothetical protein
MRRDKNGIMMFNNKPMEPEAELRLDELFRAYRAACPEPEASVNFMPEIWAKIEARQISTNLFGRMAKALVTVALAATVVLGLVASVKQSNSAANFNGTYMEALTADHISSLEPLNLERISELEQQ